MTCLIYLKASAKKKIYGGITVISTVLAVLGGAIQVYAFFEGQAEEQTRRQEEERRLEEEAKKSEADKLREQIAFAKTILPDCNYPDDVEIEISSILNRSERELILNNNFSGSKGLYEGVRMNITLCEPLLPPPIELPPVGDGGSPGLGVPAASPIIFTIGVLSLSAIVFGSLWYRTSKRESRERRTSE